jgi:hypothetical protein
VIRPTVAAACAAAVLAAGCGADRSDDEAGVKRTIHAAIREALVDHDLHAGCARASRRGHALLLHWYRLSYPERRFRDCEGVVRFEVGQERDRLVPTLRRTLGVIGKVRFDGPVAVAQVTDQAGGSYVSVRLRKRGGQWLIEDSSAIPRGM